MNAWAYRGTTFHAKNSGTYCGKNSIQIANHAAAVAPRNPQIIWDRGGQIIDILPHPERDRSRRCTDDEQRPDSTPRAPETVPDPHRRVRQSAIGKGGRADVRDEPHTVRRC